jgi:hypothetical protein
MPPKRKISDVSNVSGSVKAVKREKIHNSLNGYIYIYN